jgi:hypothetical protein
VALLIGFDRESRNKPAGLRTNVLVGMGSALFTLVGIYAFGPGDPGSRVAAQIVTGIGFLGAGTIIQVRSGVMGDDTDGTDEGGAAEERGRDQLKDTTLAPSGSAGVAEGKRSGATTPRHCPPAQRSATPWRWSPEA